VISEMNVPVHSSNVRLDTHLIPQGIYVIKLQYANGASAVRKVIVQH